MKGQRLFVRFAEPADLEELQNFYRNDRQSDNFNEIATPEKVAESLIGKLVGDLVAHSRFTRNDNTVILQSIYVARLLRRKRIGRFMISELARLAGGEGADQIVAPAGCGAASFLRACGFEASGNDDTLTMKINLEEEL